MTNYVSGGKIWLPNKVQAVFPPNKYEIVTRASSWTLIVIGSVFSLSLAYLAVSRHFAWEYKEINKSPELLNILVNEASNNILIGFAVASIVCIIIGVFKLLSLSNIQQNRKVNPLRHGWQNSILLFIVVILGLAALGTILSTNDSASTVHNKSVASFESWMKLQGLDVTHEQASEVIDDAWGQKNSNMYAVKTFEKPLVIDGKAHTVEIAKRGDNNLFFSVDTKKSMQESNSKATERVNW